MLPAPMRGIITPLVTPLAHGALETASLERLIEHVLAGGMNGLFILGTTGEGPSLSYALQEEMIRQTCQLVRARVPVLVSVSHTSLAESERLAEVAANAGADAVVIAPPYYFQYSQKDLVRYIEVAAFRFPLPLFLYNIPQLTKVAFEVETLRHLARVPGVIGLKDSSNDLTYLSHAVQAVSAKPEFTVLCGPEEILIHAMRSGCHGGVCGGSNLFPTLFRDLYRNASTGHWDRASANQTSIQEVSKAIYSTGFAGASYLRGLKSALELSGLCRAEFAPPLTKFTNAEYVELAGAFHGLRERYLGS